MDDTYEKGKCLFAAETTAADPVSCPSSRAPLLSVGKTPIPIVALVVGMAKTRRGEDQNSGKSLLTEPPASGPRGGRASGLATGWAPTAQMTD